MTKAASFLLLLFLNYSIEAQSKLRLYPVKVDKKWGMIDAKGKITVNPIYDAVGESDPLGQVPVQSGGKIGLCNVSGTEVLPCKYDRVVFLKEKVYQTLNGKKWELWHNELGVIYSGLVEDILVLGNDCYAVQYDSTFDIVGKNGFLINNLPQPLTDVKVFSTEPLTFELTDNNNKKGVCDEAGKILVPVRFDDIKVSKGLWIVREEEKFGLYDTKGKQILEPQYQKISLLKEDYVVIQDESKEKVYKVSESKIISEGKTRYADLAGNLMYEFLGFVGLSDYDGNEILSAKYDELGLFADTIWRYSINEKWGLASVSRDELTPPLYNFISRPDRTVAIVKLDTLTGVVNFKGTLSVPLSEGTYSLFNNTLKATIKGKINTLYFDDEGRPSEKEVFTNYRTLKVRQSNDNPSTAGQVLFNNAFITATDSLTFEKYAWEFHQRSRLWGLRDLKNGAWKIKPIYDKIQVVKDLGFTVGYISSSAYSRIPAGDVTMKFTTTMGLISNDIGAAITLQNIIDLNLNDVLVRKLPVMRVIFSNGKHGIMTKKGKIIAKDYAWIGDFTDGCVVASKKGTLKGSVKDSVLSPMNFKKYFAAMDVSMAYSGDHPPTEYAMERAGNIMIEGAEWGAIDTLCNTVVPFQYQYLFPVKNHKVIAVKNSKWGVVSDRDSMVIPQRYDKIEYLTKDSLPLFKLSFKNPKMGFIKSDGTVAVQVNYKKVRNFCEDRVAVCIGDKWGFSDSYGKEIIPCQYAEVSDFSEGLAAVKINRKWGFIDNAGNLVIPANFSKAGSFRQQKAWVQDKNLYGYIDKNGNYLIEPQFQRASGFSVGRAIVRLNSKEGIIDETGKTVLKPTYIDIEDFDSVGMAIANLGGGEFCLLDLNGEKVGKEKFNKIFPFKEGVARVIRDGKYGYINDKGELITSCHYAYTEDFCNGMGLVRQEQKWGFVDKSGREVIPAQYVKAQNFKDDLAVVFVSHNKSGLIDKSGKYILEANIDRLKGYSEGLALIRYDNKYYSFVPIEGAGDFPDRYQDALAFNEGATMVKINNRWKVLNRQGMLLAPTKFSKVEPFEQGVSKVQIETFFGIADPTGKIIVDTDYDFISADDNNLFRVERGDTMGYINNRGMKVF